MRVCADILVESGHERESVILTEELNKGREHSVGRAGRIWVAHPNITSEALFQQIRPAVGRRIVDEITVVPEAENAGVDTDCAEL